MSVDSSVLYVGSALLIAPLLLKPHDANLCKVRSLSKCSDCLQVELNSLVQIRSEMSLQRKLKILFSGRYKIFGFILLKIKMKAVMFCHIVNQD